MFGVLGLYNFALMLKNHEWFNFSNRPQNETKKKVGKKINQTFLFMWFALIISEHAWVRKLLFPRIEIRVPLTLKISVRIVFFDFYCNVDRIARSWDIWILISKFYVDSKNVSEKFLHRCSSVMKDHPLLPPKDEKNLPLRD